MVIHLNSVSQKPNRVLVIGGTGFLGKCVVAKLIDNSVEVLSLGSKEINLLESSSVDVLTRLLKSTDTVIFSSAITPDKGRDIDAFMKNILMMKHLCKALNRIKIAHLIYFSSDAVYGQKQSFLSEESPLAPQDLYGAMHLSRELMLLELSDISVAILRITAAYGAEDTHTSYGPNRFLSSALKNQTIDLFGCGEEFRDHIYGDDVAVITDLCIHMRSCGLLNVATGKSYRFKKVAEIIADQCNKPVKIHQNARSSPITHKHFDITNLLKAFPSLYLTGLEEGLKLSQIHKLKN